MSSDPDEWFDRAEEALADLSEGTDDEGLENAVDTVRTLVAVLDEVEDASEFVDASQLPEAVEFDELFAAVEPSDVPAAVRESDPKKAVRTRQLLRAVDLKELWGSADIRELWRQKRDIEDAMDGVDDEGDGDADDGMMAGLLGDDESDDEGATSDLLDDGEEDPLRSVGAELEAALGDGEEDEEEDDGIVSELLEDDDGDDTDDDDTDEGVVSGLLDDGDAGDAASDASEGDGSSDEGLDITPDALEGMGDVPQESKQTAIQRKAMKSVDEFRESLIDVHNKLEGVVEENRGKARENRENGSSSRNPVAHSTLPEAGSDLGGGTRYSTVPRETRHSTAPNRKHVYGHRFSTMRGGADG